ALFRPLFFTSYTAVDFLREHDFFGAKQIVVSSASSKTAYGAAWRLAGEDVELIGLTGDRNRAFVEGLGVYHRVCGYDEVEALPTGVPTLYLDLAGDPALRRRVHARFAGDLTYDCLVGSTQGDAFPREAPELVGPPPVFFFGATCPAAPWIRIVELRGLEAAATVVRALADGRSDPAEGAVVRLAR